MKKLFLAVFALALSFSLSGVVLKGPSPEKEEKTIRDFEKGEISLAELQKKYRKFLQENQKFLQEKHKALLTAQRARNAYLVNAGKKDPALQKDLPFFSRGQLRNLSDKTLFIRVYGKLGKDPEFLQLDKALWKAKLHSVIGSFERQKGVPGIDLAVANFEKISRKYQETLRKGALKALGNGKTFLSAEKGSILYRAALGEIETFGKKASPREVFQARQRISSYLQELFRVFRESHPTLKKTLEEQEKALIERNIYLFKLQLAHEEAAYAQYIKTFGVTAAVKGKLMNEIMAGDQKLQLLEKNLAAGKEASQKESNRLLKVSDHPSAKELRNFSARVQLLFGKKR